MTTSERIASAIKSVLDEDRRADRERIAELERDAAHFASVEKTLDNWQTIIDELNKQIDELTEKCAALVAENRRLREDDEPEQKPLDVAAMNRVLDAAGVPPVKQEPTLRIDTDMSDPQPGKLLVVRLEESDAYDVRGNYTFEVDPSQRVGFLVETPPVKRTPKVGDKVRFSVDSNHPGIIGVVSHDLGDGSMLVSQGGAISHNRPNFVALPTDLEVIG